MFGVAIYPNRQMDIRGCWPLFCALGESIVSDMAKPWAPTSNSAVAGYIANLLKEGARDQALLYVLQDACAARFDELAEILERASNVGGVRLLFNDKAADSFALQVTFEMCGFDPRCYLLFATACDVAREVSKVRGKALGGKTQRFILEKVLADPRVRKGTPAEMIDMLQLQVSQHPATPAPAAPGEEE